MTIFEIESNRAKHAFKKSTLAVCIAALTAGHAYGQETTAATEDPAALEEVVVYGVKQSLQNAQEMKRDAATVKDVITASDIGALPDKSVVEALQRVPGVTIERFEASNDPDHFSVEGGNVTVRGLNRVRSEFNGRDAFSAGADGGLNFSDIPPELVGSVAVSKNLTADMTEGGVAGTINLVTRKPFDSDDLALGVNVKASYGDLIDEVTPAVSAIASNVWSSDVGRFGALLSLSGSNFTSRGDGVGIYNYYGQYPFIQNGVVVETRTFTDGAGNPAALPPSPRVNQQFNDRDRMGVATSLQWESPSETVLATLDFIRSDSKLAWTERFIENPNQPFSGDTINNLMNIGYSDVTFDCPASPNLGNPCQFRSGIISGGSYPWGAVPSIAGTRAREDERVINDLSLNVQFTPNEKLKIVGDIQYVDASNDIVDTTAHGKFYAESVLLNLGDDGAGVEFLNPAVGEASSYFFRSAMDHVSKNEGESLALQLDGEYVFDDSWISSVKTGFRMSNKETTIRESAYNWGNVSETWVGGVGQGNEPFFSEFTSDGFVESFTFDDHLSGKALKGNSTFWFPSEALVSNSEAMYQAFINNGIRDNADGWVPLHRRPGVIDGTSFLPSEIYLTEEDRGAIYVRVDFGNEEADQPYSGNFGLRYVDWQISAAGADNFPNPPSGELIGTGRDPSLPAIDPALTPDQIAFANSASGITTTVKGKNFTRVLPSFNFKYGVNEDLIFRFAASESIWLPDILSVRNRRNIDAQYSVINEDLNGSPETLEVAGVIHNGFYANGAGNPQLQPEIAANYDMAFEWYFADVGSVTTTLFYKRVRDFHRQATVEIDVTNPSNGVTQRVNSTQTVNAGVAEIRGYEIAFQTTFEALGEAFAPFGIQTSYTKIEGEEKSSAVATPVGDEANFGNFTGLPLEGLSEDNYNVVVFYDQELFQARLAYSWRSDYLLNSRDVIAFAPVYGESTGQLDGSISYKISDNFKVGLEANNLTDEITKTTVQYNQGGVRTPRSYFANDRRFALFFQATY